MSKVERLFVGNLPAGTTGDQLNQEFSAYGQVETVDVKTKSNQGNDVNTFAFVTIAINGHALAQCLQEFKEYKYQNRYLTVSVAKENFLDKLKREREEAAKQTPNAIQTKPISIADPKPKISLAKISDSSGESDGSSDESSDDSTETPGKPISLPQQQQQQKRKRQVSTSSESESSSDEDSADLILRKKSKNFLQNGKIIIETNSTAKPIHIIQTNSKSKRVNKEIHGKAKDADIKRMESMKKMTETYNMKQQVIKQSLNITTPQNKKITFDNDDDDNEKTSQKKRPLFDENDSDNENEQSFTIREEYMGERGAKLQKLNMKHGTDQRFQMNAEFLDEQKDASAIGTATNEKNEEREWQFNILENIIGHKLQSDFPQDKTNKHKTMLRYDPDVNEHAKYSVVQPTVGKEPVEKSKKKKPETNENVTSEERFYKVSNNIKRSLNGDTNTFSLLSMFGRIKENEENPKTEFKANLMNNTNQKVKQPIDDINPFKYDSSDDEDEIYGQGESQAVNNNNIKSTTQKPSASSSSKQPKLWQENFFITGGNDERLNDGLQFFLSPKDEAPDNSELLLQSEREEMRTIIKKKMKRAIKSKLPHGAKPNKKFRKFARNL